MYDAKIRAYSAPWYSAIQLGIFSGDRRARVKNVVFEDIPEGAAAEPSFSLSIQNAQILMDDLWASGIRPTEGSGSAGSMRATEKHLDDMRKIAFKQLDIRHD